MRNKLDGAKKERIKKDFSNVNTTNQLAFGKRSITAKSRTTTATNATRN